MSGSASLSAHLPLGLAERAVPEPQPRRGGPLLIGDVTAARAGVPELLIQIARQLGEDDPAPSA